MGVAVVYRVRGTGVGSYPDMGAGEWEWRLAVIHALGVEYYKL